MGIFSKNLDQENNSNDSHEQTMDKNNNDAQKPTETVQSQGNEQAKMPNESQGYTKEIDGKKYHFSGAEQTHVIPEVSAEELDKKTEQEPKEAIQEQKANLNGSPENK